MMRAVLFDCDSTLSAVEGIDLLAERAGVRAQTAPLTQAAMEGRLPLEEVYRRRLELIRPTRAAVTWLGQRYVAKVVTGAQETVSALHALGHEVHIVSGGIRQAVLALAEFLTIPAERVHAVDVVFDAGGAYAGFDAGSPLCASGGKAEVCRRLLQHGGSAVMVGDGVTDLEAAEAGVPVIGFGGIIRRDAVAKNASAYVDAPSLTAVLDVILAPAERERLRGQEESRCGG
ncbi:MAG: HAD-IB family phosphatase [Chromatiales bacterium]